jgi:hemoglobin
MTEQTSNHYQRIGGEAGVRALVVRFYQVMEELPESYGIRKMHPADIKISEEKLFKFLSGWMGGPQLFVQEYGHPMLRQRHMPFTIGKEERNQWLMCMDIALRETLSDEALRQELTLAFVKVAEHMRNRAD